FYRLVKGGEFSGEISPFPAKSTGKLNNTGSDAEKACHDRTPHGTFPASERGGERTGLENRGPRRGGGNCLQNSRGPWPKIPDEDVRTRGRQGGLASPCAAASFETDIAFDATP